MREILAGYGMKRYNESQEHYRMYVADGMDVKRNAEIPMSAFWIRDNGFYQLSPLPEADIRESASVAHIYGQNVCAAESFTTYGLGTVDGVRAYINTPGNLKHAADAAMSYGLNRFVIHCSVHQPCDDKIPGLGLGPYGQWFNRHETWAHEAKAWIDYLGRSTYMLQQGKFVADIAYFYGEDKNITRRFGNERLKVPGGYSFDFVNASILQNVLKIKNHNLTTASGMSYKVLVLDEQIRFMSLPVLKRIAQMAKSGVIIIGNQPQACANLNADQKQFDKLVNEVWNSGRANVYPFSAMAQALGKAGVAPDVNYLSQNTGKVHFVHRQLSDGHIYWFANISPEARNVTVSCRVSGKKPYVLHPETGRKEEIAYQMLDGRTIITLDLTADDAQFVIFDENTSAAKHELPATELVERMSISSPWTVNFQENRGASAQAVFQRLKSLSESNVGSVRYFSGTARYSCTFHWNSAAPKDALYLDLGEVYNMARVKLNGTVVDIRHLCGEIERLHDAGVYISPENLMISSRAIIVMPYHVALDGLEEARLSDKPYGSTKRGIAPVYGDKYMKKGIMLGELFDREYLVSHLSDVLEFKNLQITRVYGGEPFSLESMVEYLDTYGEILKPYIGDTSAYLRKAAHEGKKILYEAQLGVLRDIDFGIYPYTSSSSPLAAYAPIGSGAPDIPVNRVIGVVKAYSTCVGEGPFTAEWFGEEAERLRKEGGEYGAATGRPRRVGPIDLVATRYGVQMQGATEVALTKLDILSYMDSIPVCAAYECDGEVTRTFPFPSKLGRAKPIYVKLPGWGCDISKIRTYDELPENARKYVEYVEREIGCRISYVSVGPGREEIILR